MDPLHWILIGVIVFILLVFIKIMSDIGSLAEGIIGIFLGIGTKQYPEKKEKKKKGRFFR